MDSFDRDQFASVVGVLAAPLMGKKFVMYGPDPITVKLWPLTPGVPPPIWTLMRPVVAPEGTEA